jgi:hypothetical protein
MNPVQWRRPVTDATYPKRFCAILLLLLSCRSSPLLFECQKLCNPDPALSAQARAIRSADDLAPLQPGTAYKYVVDAAGTLLVAPQPASTPGNPIHHPVLGRGAPVRAGGYLTVEHTGTTVTKVIVDQDTKGYCATFPSLNATRAALLHAGVPATAIQLADRPPGCAPRLHRAP